MLSVRNRDKSPGFRASFALGAAGFALALTASPALATPPAPYQESPIDIITSTTVYDPSKPALQFNYGSAVSVTEKIINPGSNVPADVEGTVRAIPNDLSGGVGANSLTIGATTYYLQQLHFHVGSEHLVNGVGSAMEVHFVNKATDGSYAVVGEFMNIGAENPYLKQFFDTISTLAPTDQATSSPFIMNLAALLPSDLASYRYVGSLTTAPYSAPINWNVLTQSVITVSQAQVDQFSALFGNGNAREPQTVLADTVVYYVPEPTGMLAMLGGGLTMLFARRRKAARTAA